MPLNFCLTKKTAAGQSDQVHGRQAAATRDAQSHARPIGNCSFGAASIVGPAISRAGAGKKSCGAAAARIGESFLQSHLSRNVSC